MIFNTVVPKKLKPFFKKEMDLYQMEYETKNYESAWHHLERAHIIGQKYPYVHSLVHWKMLQFGIRTKNSKEIIGQIPRLIFGGVKSFVGTIPIGNPGGANVRPLKPFPIALDVKEIFEKTGV